MAKVKKVTGTSKVDTITVTGSYATVNKKKISIAASGVTVKAGKSNDIININGGGKTKAPNKFYGEAGNDTFVIGKTSTGVAVVKDFNKSGTDKVKVTGSTVKSVSLSGKNLIIKGGKSASLTLEGAKGKTISLEDSRGKYTMSSSAITLDKTFGGTLNSSTFLSSITNINGSKATKTVTVNAGSNIKTITGGSGINKVNLSGGTASVNTGAGNDVITVKGGNKHTLRGGTGSDQYVINSSITNSTRFTINQSDYKSKDADTLKLANVNRTDVTYGYLNGTLTIKHKTGGTITISGWNKNPFSKIVFKDGSSVTGATVTKNAVTEYNWALGHKVTVSAAALAAKLQINGYKDNDFVATLDSSGALVLRDVKSGALTITGWKNNKLTNVTFKAGSYTKSFTASAFNDRIFTVTALENGAVYSGGASQRQQFNLELNASTDVTISSVSGSEDRIKLTDHHSTENFNFRIEGNDFYIYDYDPETNSQTGGKIVLKNYKENTVKAIEFDDTTYHFVTGNDTISNVSDTYSDRYVFLDNDWRSSETAGEPWEVTVEDFTPGGALDFRFLPNNGRYYSIASEADGRDMVLTYKYSPTPTTGATLGTIRLKNFFNADGTVNETTGFTKIRTIREVYSGNRSANAWDSWVWDGSNQGYRFLRLNAGTSGDDTVNLGAARPAGGASAWMYFAGDGGDTITAKEGDIVYGEAGADTIDVTGHYGEAHGGIGNDTITIQSVNGNNRHHAVVRGDDGDDVINAYGSYHYINGGSGDDEIHIYSGENSDVESHHNGISGSRGNDKIYIHAGDNHVANGGADNDKIYIYGGNNTRANGGDGTDTITVTGGTGHVANGGTEGDVITVTGGTGHVVNGGVGSDRYVVDMDFTADTKLTVDQMNSDGADTDILQLSKVNKDDVEFAVENGTLTITHSNGGTITVEGWGNHPLAQIQFADNQSMTADEINEALAEPAVVTVTQQSVIKNFMKSLDNSNMIMEDVEGALNTAVAYASNNVYDSWNGLVNSFVDEVKKYGATTTAEAKDFLATYCGIDLDNEDTGSITGADAGGAAVKTAISIVPENGTMADAIAPTDATTTINELTFEWPIAIENDKQQAIINALNTWWAKEGLGLIEESYGLSFNEAGTTVNKIKVEFYTDADVSTLAAVYNSSYSDGDHAGEATTLWLRINMAKFNDIDLDDVNGFAGQTSGYLDRTIAHELTHAVMAANITGFNKLPDSISEGAAELVHGIDDFRTTTISALALKANVEQLETALLNTEPPTYATSYSGGYMLLRYFAKQVADRANNVEVNASPNVAATVDFDMIEKFTSSSMLAGNAMTVSDLGENSLAIASIQNSLIDFADSRISDSLAGVQQEDKQNSSLFITGNV